MEFKQIGTLKGPEGCKPIPIYESVKTLTTADVARETGVDADLLKTIYNRKLSELLSDSRKHGVKMSFTVKGDCLEGIGILDKQKVLVHSGEFNYIEGDIVLIQDLEGNVMLKEFSHWISDNEIAMVRTRYKDESKNYSLIIMKEGIYGKVEL
ncbi:MAG: hypothetical protein PWR12_2104 [Eubacteriaceae bacterium]|nr:hypothetical protein [Eubacteriaceae bacterium]